MIWDYAFYWGLLAPLFFGGRIADLRMLSRLRALSARAEALNASMQPLLREWGERNGAPVDSDARLLDQFNIDWFREMNRGLNDVLDDDAFFARIGANVARLEWLAMEILQRARAVHPGIGDHGFDALLAAGAPAEGSLSAAWYAAA